MDVRGPWPPAGGIPGQRLEGLQAMQATMADILAGPPEFTDLTVADEWTG